MTHIVLYIATTKDGFIADVNGGIDWLPQTLEETHGQDYGYGAFYQTVDALVMGRKTYEQILSFGDWPYPGKPTYVFTHTPLQTENPEITFLSDDIPQFIASLENEHVKKLWVVGGAGLIESFYANGRIDEAIITVFPKEIGSGILLPSIEHAVLENSINFGGNVVQNQYLIQDR
ncbi:MAG: dihydrofolate reductase family protein [Chlamydiales bacterium]|nr:dihydrofolate reductase family protein [Chlamydiales bacterium]